MKMSKKQEETARRLAKEWSGGYGDQPWALIARNGGVFRSNQYAVCLGGLPSTYFKAEDNPVLIQFSVYRENKKTYKRTSIPESTKPVLEKWFRYLVNRPDFQDGFFEHSVAFRFEVGIPIKIMDRADMWPLMASTFVRFFWDRHNTTHAKDVLYIMEHFQKIPIDRAFIIGNLIGNPDGRSRFNIAAWSGVHSPFGKELSFKRTKQFIKKELPFRKFYTKKRRNQITWGEGLNTYFAQGETTLVEHINGHIGIKHKESKGWGSHLLEFDKKHYKTVVNRLDTILKELKND
jgi:hypothetical protein